MKGRLKKIAVVTPFKITLFVIVGALAAFFVDAPFVRFMELKALDLRMISRGPLPTTGVVAIAAVDEKSLSEIGRWPWSRAVIAQLIEKLKEDGAKTVAFDVVFSEPDENASLKTIKELAGELRRIGIADPRLMGLLDSRKKMADTDAILAKSTAVAKNVTAGYFFYTSPKEIQYMSRDEIERGKELVGCSRYPMVMAKNPPSDNSVFINAYAAIPSLKEISEAAVNCGFFNAFPDPDGVIRWAPLVVKFGEDYYYSLAVAALIQFADMPMSGVRLADFGVESVVIGDISIPVDERGRLLINYLGPAKTFPHYSITDILKGHLPRGTFQDKIVIVGATATGIYDLRVTPFSNVYPGIEIHANVIDNIITGNFLERSAWTSFVDVCSIICFGLVMGLTIPRVKAFSGVLLSLLLVGLFVLANTMVFVHYRIWLNMMYPVITMMTIYLLITVYRYVTEEKEKKKIRGAFQYYLTASVINEILQDPSKLKLGGDKKDLSVMFSDIRGFTTISERLTPEELVALLNEYLTAMTEKVFKYDGLLDKYIGDAIMAVFGAPIDQPDHALRACWTALDMMEELKVLQVKWEKEGKPHIDIGIGINSGDMVVGNMGSDMRFDYTVMGDNVNLSSRLEGINKEYGTHIVISENTYERVKDRMFCRELDAVRVKGKKLPVKIYELICPKEKAAEHEGYVKLFEEGLALYRQCRWDEAIAVFEKVHEIRPGGDPTSLIYIERCRDLKDHPPEMPWDGVYTMTKK